MCIKIFLYCRRGQGDLGGGRKRTVKLQTLSNPLSPSRNRQNSQPSFWNCSNWGGGRNVSDINKTAINTYHIQCIELRVHRPHWIRSPRILPACLPLYPPPVWCKYEEDITQAAGWWFSLLGVSSNFQTTKRTTTVLCNAVKFFYPLP